jgi:hypothetical protein
LLYFTLKAFFMPSTVGLLRLHNQRIAHLSARSPAEVLTWMGAIQGQDYSGAKWSIGLRLPATSDADIERAVAERQIIRTWLLRGTLHLAAATDVRWLLALVAPGVTAGFAYRYRQLELDDQTFARSRVILAEVLRGGRQMQRRALFEVLEAAGVSVKGQRGIYILHHHSNEGLLVQGVAERDNPFFMLLDEVIPPSPLLSREVALAKLARRYFQSHAPSTLQDFAAWSGLKMAEVRVGFGSVQAELIEETIDGGRYWLPTDMPSIVQNELRVDALPGFDEFILGYRERGAVLDPVYADRICPGGNGVFYPTIVVNGRVVGTWKREFKKGSVIVTPSPFAALSAAERDGFVAACGRYAAYLGMPLQMA